MATAVPLVEIGPNNVDPTKMTSPMDVTIVEVGRTGASSAREGRSPAHPLRLRPLHPVRAVGWKPLVREKVTVSFQAKPNLIPFNVSFVIDEIARGK